MDRLRVLLDDPDEVVRNMAYVLIRVAAIRPYKRKRLKHLLKVDRTLAQDFVEAFLGAEWIDAEYSTMRSSFEDLELGDRSIRMSSDSVKSDFDIPF